MQKLLVLLLAVACGSPASSGNSSGEEELSAEPELSHEFKCEKFCQNMSVCTTEPSYTECYDDCVRGANEPSCNATRETMLSCWDKPFNCETLFPVGCESQVWAWIVCNQPDVRTICSQECYRCGQGQDQAACLDSCYRKFGECESPVKPASFLHECENGQTASIVGAPSLCFY